MKVRGERIFRPAALLAGAALFLCLGLAGPGLRVAASQPSAPESVLQAFLNNWSRRDWAAMRRLALNPPADFAQVNESAFQALGVSGAAFSSGPLSQGADRATAPVSERLRLSVLGTVQLRTEVTLVEAAGRWWVEWTPGTIYPALAGGGHFAISTTWPPRAPILGAGGAPLTTQAPMVIVGVEGSYVKNAASLTSALTAAGASLQAVTAALAAARQHPTWFEPVFTVTWARYQQLKPKLYPLPGTVFQRTTARAAITPGLQAHLVGVVGPITAQELAELGAPYGAASLVGQNGLEQVYQARLAGSPAARITVVSSGGALRATVAVIPARPGSPVETGIVPAAQKAAEAALAPVHKFAAMVAVKASTGEVIASVSDPAAYGFDQALDGVFPPGSTFKTITSTALIEDGLSPSSAASCPNSITIDGEVFHNAEGEAPVDDMAQAFTESCNTAFIGLAAAHLRSSSLEEAAALYDVGRTPEMGIAAFGGSVPATRDEADLAASAIGQGRVLMSPLDLAMVAADIDSGVVREPRLVVGAPDDSAPAHALPRDVVTDLREMMADVVARGTAAGQGLPPGTYAKTGTAEYTSGGRTLTDAWLMGFNGDVAFSVLVVAGGYGGPTCGPLAAKFLKDLGMGK